MHDSVEHHKISDVEVGSFLSSGVDSSYVAATFNGDKTFTVGFDYEKYNEIDYAKALSDKIKIDNYSKLVSSEEYWAAIPKIQYHMDEPLADPAAIALYFVSQTAAKHVRLPCQVKVLTSSSVDITFPQYLLTLQNFRSSLRA